MIFNDPFDFSSSPGEELNASAGQSAASSGDSVGLRCAAFKCGVVSGGKPGESDEASRVSRLILRVKIAAHEPTESEADEG